MKKIVELTDVSFSYNHHKVLDNISFDVFPKDFMAVLGPNGGGKTTLLKLLLGLLKPDKGHIKILGEKPKKVRKKIGYVPQYAEFDKDFPILVKEVVMMSSLKANSFFPGFDKQTKKNASEILDFLSISHLAGKKMGDLSGGQKQRTLIARALMSDPEILLLDEPMASLDVSVEEDIYKLLKNLNNTKTIIFVTHDIGVISSYVNRMTCLNVCACTHTIEEMNEESIVQVYAGYLHKLNHKCKL